MKLRKTAVVVILQFVVVNLATAGPLQDKNKKIARSAFDEAVNKKESGAFEKCWSPTVTKE